MFMIDQLLNYINLKYVSKIYPTFILIDIITKFYLDKLYNKHKEKKDNLFLNIKISIFVRHNKLLNTLLNNKCF